MSSKIVIFACNWCSPITKDIETIEGKDILVIRYMCSGRFEPSFALKAFELGAKEVIVVGCPDGKCHYGSGNKQAEEQVERTQNLLQLLGIGGQKIRYEFIHRDVFVETMMLFRNGKQGL
ncbi:MAG: hydrogenase iron-sulfur subunit [Candidatus Stahlbacteria bacterium]|nr:hydrogenase iron-sulfur subunit [Candidatus Stahlbacteria bacterium]